MKLLILSIVCLVSSTSSSTGAVVPDAAHWCPADHGHEDCEYVQTVQRPCRLLRDCWRRGTTRWKLSPLALLNVWGEHAVICAYSFVFSHGENLHVSLHDLFSATPYGTCSSRKWLHRCLVVRAKQAAMQITYGTCPRNSLIYDQPQCVSTSLVKSRVLLC